ncbi:MAG: site-specific integrase [Phycisphaerae bacterium]|nr:site-specific integrase [Phycisphaerae bacterium]
MSNLVQSSLPGIPGASAPTKVLSEEEILRLFEVAKNGSPRDYTMIRMAIFTGLRNSELLGLTIEHVRPYGAVTRVLELPGRIAKNRKPRSIPLRTELQEDLAKFLEWKQLKAEPTNNWSPLFVSQKTHQRLSPRDFQRIVKHLAIVAIHRKIHPHVLRHTFATKAMRMAPTPVVQELLGHSSLQSTMRYVHPNSDDLAQCVERM